MFSLVPGRTWRCGCTHTIYHILMRSDLEETLHMGFFFVKIKFDEALPSGFHLVTKFWSGSANIPVGIYSVPSSLGRTFKRISFLGDFL